MNANRGFRTRIVISLAFGFLTAAAFDITILRAQINSRLFSFAFNGETPGIVLLMLFYPLMALIGYHPNVYRIMVSVLNALVYSALFFSLFWAASGVRKFQTHKR